MHIIIKVKFDSTSSSMTHYIKYTRLRSKDDNLIFFML